MKKKFTLKPSGYVDVRPLSQRESPLNIRKGLPQIKAKGYFDLTEYTQQTLFNDNNIEGNEKNL